jgi:hypothetical protein
METQHEIPANKALSGDLVLAGAAGTVVPAMTDVLFCKCRGEPMRWAKDARRSRGGYWRCKVKSQESDRRWREANPHKVMERNDRSNPGRLYVGGMYVGYLWAV